MTDNEIIKALECCALKHKDCEECPILSTYCEIDLHEYALDLINHQKAEIERLEKKANTPFAEVTFDENKLKEIVDERVKNIEIDINLVKSKAKAIKEFAERLKEKLQWDTEFENMIVFDTDIDNLLKEMEGSE